MSRRVVRVHLGFLALTTVLCTVFVLTDGVPRRAAVVLSSLLPAVALLVQLLRGRVTRPTPWWLVTGALVALTAHNLQSLVQVGVLGRPAAGGIGPLVTLPLGYLLLLTAAAMVAFPFARRDVGGILDGVVVALGAASLVWALGVQPTLAARGDSVGDRTYELTILLLVSSIAGAVTRALAVSRAARPVLLYLLLAVLLTLAGNVVGEVLEDPVSGAQPWWIGLLWIVAYLALGAASVHPSRAQLGAYDVRRSSRLTTTRLAYLGVVLALNPTIAGVAAATGSAVDWLLLSATSLAMVPLVILRIGQLARLHSRAEAELERLASVDELTGLPNRRRLTAELAATLPAVAAGDVEGAALFFVDLDDFKEINDTHGHTVGDALLGVVARRLGAAVRPTDTVARFGGDEFVILCTGAPEAVDRRIRAAVARALRDPVVLGPLTVRCRGSIGSALVGAGRARTPDALLSEADADMYRDKARRRAAPVSGG